MSDWRTKRFNTGKICRLPGHTRESIIASYAELVGQYQDQIEEAGKWAEANYPHDFEFLNSIVETLRRKSVARQMVESSCPAARFPDALKYGAVKERSVAIRLSNHQSLELLSCYLRATNPTVAELWKIKSKKWQPSLPLIMNMLRSLKHDEVKRSAHSAMLPPIVEIEQIFDSPLRK